jgi:hypothetical protein
MISITVGARFRRFGSRAVWSINELKIAPDRGEVSARLDGVVQCQIVFVWHVHVMPEHG